MKKSELRNIIKEEILKEFDVYAREKVVSNYYPTKFDLLLSIEQTAKALGVEEQWDTIMDYLYERVTEDK